MKFNDSRYSGKDFRRVERFYTLFYYDEVTTAPFVQWCTEYFYKCMKKNVYRLVYIDRYDNEITAHEEFTAKGLVDYLNQDASDRELEDYMDDELLQMLPDSFKVEKDDQPMSFNPLTANLYMEAVKAGDKDLVKEILSQCDDRTDAFDANEYRCLGLLKRAFETGDFTELGKNMNTGCKVFGRVGMLFGKNLCLKYLKEVYANSIKLDGMAHTFQHAVFEGSDSVLQGYLEKGRQCLIDRTKCYGKTALVFMTVKNQQITCIHFEYSLMFVQDAKVLERGESLK